MRGSIGHRLRLVEHLPLVFLSLLDIRFPLRSSLCRLSFFHGECTFWPPRDWSITASDDSFPNSHSLYFIHFRMRDAMRHLCLHPTLAIGRQVDAISHITRVWILPSDAYSFHHILFTSLSKSKSWLLESRLQTRVPLSQDISAYATIPITLLPVSTPSYHQSITSPLNLPVADSPSPPFAAPVAPASWSYNVHSTQTPLR